MSPPSLEAQLAQVLQDLKRAEGLLRRIYGVARNATALEATEPLRRIMKLCEGVES